MNNKNTFIIGVAGGSGSGKTTLANKIVEAFAPDATLISHDDYYKDNAHMTLEERCHINYDHPNSLDTDLLIADLKEIIAGETIMHPTYCCKYHRRRPERIKIEPNKIIILEGILLFENIELCNLCDIKIFVDTDDDLRFIRRLQRDVAERGRTVESVIEQHLKTVKPMYHQFIEPSRRNADIILPACNENEAGVKMIIDAISKKLQMMG